MKTGSQKAPALRVCLTVFVISLYLIPANSQAYKVRMAMMGNSITYGAGLADPSTECYPSQLSAMLSEIYGDTCEIRNFGVSARTMMRSSETPLWSEIQFMDALKYVPDICLILLGTNDSKPYRWDAWGDEFLTDYLAMIDTFQFRNPYTRFIVCYPTPIWEGHPYGTTFENSHNDSIVVNCINPLIDTVVEKTGAVLIDFHTPFEDSLQYFPDKLHPNAEGQRIIAEILRDTILSRNLIHEVETGLAFVSSFDQISAPTAVGDSAELRWVTIYADSVFLDGEPVDTSGSIKVLAEENGFYTLTAKGPKNASDFPLKLYTYIPEKSGLIITPSSSDYEDGDPIILYAGYYDQYGRKMSEKTSGLTWTILEGVGQFGEQTDTSIVFIPAAKGNVVVEAKEGELTVQKTLRVLSYPVASEPDKISQIRIFPNPVNERLYFQMECSGCKSVRIEVFNMLGEKVLEQLFGMGEQDNSIFELNTSDLNRGVYVYAVYQDKQVIFGQFFKYTDHH